MKSLAMWSLLTGMTPADLFQPRENAGHHHGFLAAPRPVEPRHGRSIVLPAAFLAAAGLVTILGFAAA